MSQKKISGNNLSKGMEKIKESINKLNDVTMAMMVIFALGLIAILKTDGQGVVTVLSYVVTAVGSLATGRALK